MFKPATTAFLITTAVTSAIATAPDVPAIPHGTIGQVLPSGPVHPVQFNNVAHGASDVEARLVPPFHLGPGIKIAREELDTREVEVPGIKGASGRFTTWLLNKLHPDADQKDVQEVVARYEMMNRLGFVNKTPIPSSIMKMAREDLELEARGKIGKAATSVGGQAANGAAGALTTWALNKLRSEDLELEARGAIGKAATSVGGQAANGAAGALTTWALGKIKREDLMEVRDAIDELLERDDQEYMEAREFLEDYMEARDYELEDLE
jgi:hypothetical protein